MMSRPETQHHPEIGFFRTGRFVLTTGNQRRRSDDYGQYVPESEPHVQAFLRLFEHRCPEGFYLFFGNPDVFGKVVLDLVSDGVSF